MTDPERPQMEAKCQFCVEDIRLDLNHPEDGWEDRDTGHTCERGRNRNKPHQPADTDVIAQLTLAVREADQTFQRTGGGSRHWVNECFLPELEKHGLKVVANG